MKYLFILDNLEAAPGRSAPESEVKIIQWLCLHSNNTFCLLKLFQKLLYKLFLLGKHYKYENFN